jgi:hypothetical protein
MTSCIRGSLEKASLLSAAALLLTPLAGFGQAAPTQPTTQATTSLPAVASLPAEAGQPAKSQAASAATQDRWLHVRIENQEDKGETVRVNVPVELAEKVLPTINRDRLHAGKVKIDCVHANDVDLRALADAVRTAKDGEYVTVESNDNEIRVAKQAGHLIVHVLDKGRSRKSQVEIKIPMKVVDALFSAGKDELDLVAALHALSAQGDTELVSVKDEENTVRIWLDSKNGTF